MMALPLLLALVDPGALQQPTAGVRWAVCDNGEPADLRTDIPVVVLTSADADTYVPFFTAFAVYANGAVLARRGNQMLEWRPEKAAPIHFGSRYPVMSCSSWMKGSTEQRRVSGH